MLNWRRLTSGHTTITRNAGIVLGSSSSYSLEWWVRLTGSSDEKTVEFQATNWDDEGDGKQTGKQLKYQI